jgi:DNA polymerase-3 subunit epsilon/ATP-dependent DNA helicase DinG
VTDQYVALDVEATGMDPARDDVIEVALVVFSLEGEIERYSSLVRPWRSISLDVARLTGLTQSDLNGAPLLGDISANLRRLVSGRSIVGHSVELDLGMLSAGAVTLNVPHFDTFELATLLLPNLANYSLVSVAEALGVEVEQSHRALGDALLSAAIFRELLKRIEAFDTPTLERVTSLLRAAGYASAELFWRPVQRRATGPLFALAGNQIASDAGFLTSREKPEPLRKTSSTETIDPNAVVEAIDTNGVLSHSVSGFERRVPQQQMARAVAKAFNDEQHLMVEAGTGTGKSVAYLLPAVLHAKEHGETVVVSTNTVALQDQLFRKDIPDLERALRGSGNEPAFEASVLKGRQNYLCLRRWFTSQRQAPATPEDAGMRAKVSLWIGDTPSGDRAELRLTQEEESQFRHVSADGEACASATCVYQQKNQCFLFRARREAAHAHVVVTNHALLLTDTSEEARIFPHFERLIVDEAHHLEDQATTQFGFSVSENLLFDALDQATRADPGHAPGAVQVALLELNRAGIDEKSKDRAQRAVERSRALLAKTTAVKLTTNDLFVRLKELLQDADAGPSGAERTLRVTLSIRRKSEWSHVETLADRLTNDLAAIENDLAWFADAVERAKPADADQLTRDANDNLVLDLQNLQGEVLELHKRLSEIVLEPTDESVYWIERDNFRGTISLRAAPLHVGQLLNDRLFSQMKTLVLTSATLTSDGSFDYLKERLSLEPAVELAVPSPFDYRKSTLLYIADDMPEPNAPGYANRLHSILVELGAELEGRTLVLFTSHAALQAAYRAIKAPLEDRGIVALAQRTDGSARQLIERLRNSERVMLLGTSTFWEGVDVVGEALSGLVITKLPFAVPSEPVFAARSEGFDEPFNQYAIPQAILKFKQGFGRLIRSSKDRGVCAILDRRVISKRYGAAFLHSLPECHLEYGRGSDLPGLAREWIGLGGKTRSGRLGRS